MAAVLYDIEIYPGYRTEGDPLERHAGVRLESDHRGGGLYAVGKAEPGGEYSEDVVADLREVISVRFWVEGVTVHGVTMCEGVRPIEMVVQTWVCRVKGVVASG